jgi:hypothetical protein
MCQKSTDRAAAQSGNCNDVETRSRDEKDMFQVLLSAIHELKSLNRQREEDRDGLISFRNYEMDGEERINFIKLKGIKLKEDILSLRMSVNSRYQRNSE